MNDQVRDLVRQLNDSRIEVQNLKREISEHRGSGDRKNEELANALNNYQAKSGELDSYIRKSNEQKNNLMKIIDRLED
jgi:chromosome segregation ATPase